MPYWREKVPLGKDRDARIKLKPEDKERIIELYQTGLWSKHALAREFGVSRRLISFIIHPERREENLKRLAERGGWRIYYSREKNREYIKKHRHRKQMLIREDENPRKKKGENKHAEKTKADHA